jgi:transcriptional regulator with XRE-family HTH domain
MVSRNKSTKKRRGNPRGKSATSRFAESASMITGLRSSLGINKAELARLVGVTRGAISHWENGTSEPSGETYFKIGVIAVRNYKDPTIFWRRAGLKPEELAETLLPSWNKAYINNAPNEVVWIPLLPKLENINLARLGLPMPDDKIEAKIPFSSRLIPHPRFTIGVRIQNDLSTLGRDPLSDLSLKEYIDRGGRYRSDPSSVGEPSFLPLAQDRTRDLHRPEFRKGDIAVIDSSVSRLDKLNDCLVALTFTPISSEDARQADKSAKEAIGDLYIGWLRLSVGIADDDPRVSRPHKVRRWNVVTQEWEWEPLNFLTYEQKAAQYRRLGVEPPPPGRSYFYYLFSADFPDERSPITNVVHSPDMPELELDPSYKIVGQVIGWIKGEDKKQG